MKIEKVFLTKDNLLKIESIDDEFYKNAITGIEWYLKRYNEHHYAYCLFDKDSIVGYIVSIPIKKEVYDAIINGVLVNDLDINPDMFINNSNYHYIVSCVLNDGYRNQGYGKELMKKVLNDINGQACCLTISKEGFILAKKFMNLIKKLNNEVSVFEYKK